MLTSDNKNDISSLLRAFSDELASLVKEEEAIKVFFKYLLFLCDFSYASLVLDNVEGEGEFFVAYKQKEVKDLDVEKNHKQLQKLLEKKGENRFLKKAENSHPTIIVCLENDDNRPGDMKNLVLSLEVGSRFLGAISISSDFENCRKENFENQLQTLFIAFSISLEKLRIIVSAQNSKTESLVESLGDGVMMVNLNQEIIMTNQSFSRLTGIIRRPGLSLEDINVHFSSVDLKKLFDDSIKLGYVSRINEIELFDKFVEITIGPVKDHQAAIVGASLIVHDITYLKELDQMKTEFVTVASHKLRTPLTAIKLYTDMLLSGEVGESEQSKSEYLENIYQSTERSIRLVNDLLNLSKIESDRLQLDKQAVDVLALIKNVVNEVGPLAKLHGCFVDIKNEFDQLKKISLDQNLFRQALQSLLVNAIIYSKKNKGKVEVKIKKDNERLQISIKDNGIGIKENDQERVFSKFFRADNAMKANTEGTGIGLYVAKRIIESSQGRLWFKSSEGEGSVFYITLPYHG